MLNSELDLPVNPLQGHVLEPIEALSEEPQAGFVPLRYGDDLAERFIDGVANICVIVKLKAQDTQIGVWLRHSPTVADRTSNPLQLMVVIGGNPEDAGQEINETVISTTCTFKKVHHDLMLGRGIWFSLFSQCHFRRLVPPLDWVTGHPVVDQMLERLYQSKEFIDYDANLRRDFNRDALEVVGKKFANHMRIVILRGRVEVEFDAIGDELFEHVETFVGPLNPFF